MDPAYILEGLDKTLAVLMGARDRHDLRKPGIGVAIKNMEYIRLLFIEFSVQMHTLLDESNDRRRQSPIRGEDKLLTDYPESSSSPEAFGGEYLHEFCDLLQK